MCKKEPEPARTLIPEGDKFIRCNKSCLGTMAIASTPPPGVYVTGPNSRNHQTVYLCIAKHAPAQEGQKRPFLNIGLDPDILRVCKLLKTEGTEISEHF